MTTQHVLGVVRRLAAFSPQGDRIFDAFSKSLGPLTHSPWQDVVWRFSRLTTDGCPIEFSFSELDDAFRVTLEVAGPEHSDSARLSAAVALLEELGFVAPSDSMFERWRATQQSGALQWGCWLGLRGLASGLEAKLYIEVPRGAEVAAPQQLSGSRIRMLGYDPSSGACEYYAEIQEPTEARLDAVLSDLDPETRKRFVEALEALVGMPLRSLLQWVSVGASVTHRPGFRARPALFVRARAICGGAASIHRRLLGNAAYRAVIGDDSVCALPDHGIITVGARDDGAIALRAGVGATALSA